MPVQRRHIPDIHSDRIGDGVVSIRHRSFRSGRKEAIRVFRGDPLPVEVTLEGAGSERAEVLLITNLDFPNPAEWTEIPLRRERGSTFAARLEPRSCGVYQFRTKFSIDGGKTWVWDTASFSWIVVDPPSARDMRMYTMIPNVSGHIGTWGKELRRIRDLGFNTVHLLPLTKLDWSESPYAAADLFSIDESYLDPTDARDGITQLESFVEDAAALGMRLCFDLVLNHIGTKSLIARHAKHWIIPDESRPDGLKRAGCWTFHEWTSWEDLALLNYELQSEESRDQLWTYMTEYALFWGEYAAYTGGFVRLDNLHSSDPDFIGMLVRVLRAELPELGVLAEYFANEEAVLQHVPEWQLTMLLAHPWDYKFLPQLRSYLRYLSRMSQSVRFFLPVSSHDSGSPTQEFGGPQSTLPRYVISALLGTGQTGMVQGVEFGVPERVKFIGRGGTLDRTSGFSFESFITSVNRLLVDYGTFSRQGNLDILDDGHEAVLAAFRKGVEFSDPDFLVLCNLDTHRAQSLTLDLSETVGAGVLENRLSPAQTVSIGPGPNTFELEPCGVRVFEVRR